jgi:hypothetical protein
VRRSRRAVGGGTSAILSRRDFNETSAVSDKIGEGGALPVDKNLTILASFRCYR